MCKAIIAMDSFKGSLSSRDAGEAVGLALEDCGWKRSEFTIVPVSDGGEGFLEAVAAWESKPTWHDVICHDPLLREVKASYLMCGEMQTVVYIESAQVLGYSLVSDRERNALNMTSFGLGELIADAMEHGGRDFRIGLGGTVTCDGGIGMMQALGARFYDVDGMPILSKELPLSRKIGRIGRSCMKGADMRFQCWCDTSAPLIGPGGAVKLFGKQKGIPEKHLEDVEQWMINTARTFRKCLGSNVITASGAGAAGGIAGALAAFFDAELLPGAPQVLGMTGLTGIFQDTDLDLVITGEGHLDAQSRTGKLPYAIGQALSLIRKARGNDKPRVVCVAGMAEKGFEDVFDDVVSATPQRLIGNDGRPLPKALAPRMAAANLTAAVKRFLMEVDE